MKFKVWLAQKIRDIDFKEISKVLLRYVGITGLAGIVARFVLPIIVGRLEKKGDHILDEVVSREADHEENVKQAEEDMKKTEELKPDSSAAEVDDAIDDSLDHF